MLAGHGLSVCVFYPRERRSKKTVEGNEVNQGGKKGGAFPKIKLAGKRQRRDRRQSFSSK